MTPEKTPEVPGQPTPNQEVPGPEVPKPKPEAGISSVTGILIALLAAVVVGTGVWAYYNYKVLPDVEKSSETNITIPEKKTEKPTTKPTTTKDETANWKTYTNKTYGFSFKYPKTWILDQDTTWPNTVLTLHLNPENNLPKPDTDQPDLMRIEIYNSISDLDKNGQNLGASSLKDYLDKYAALSDPVYKYIKQTTIDNKNGYYAEAGPNQFGGGINFFISLGNNSIFRVWEFSSSPSFSQKISGQLHSTFQFTK